MHEPDFFSLSLLAYQSQEGNSGWACDQFVGKVSVADLSLVVRILQAIGKEPVFGPQEAICKSTHNCRTPKGWHDGHAQEFPGMLLRLAGFRAVAAPRRWAPVSPVTLVSLADRKCHVA
jgi:hypothetical protein